MLKFFKENKQTIIKLLVNRFGAIVFALMAVLLVATSDSVGAYLALSGVSVLFFCYLIYLVMWERGASDRIKVDGGRLEACPHMGLKLGLAAAAPGIVFSVLLTVSASLGAMGISAFTSAESVLDGIMIIWYAMYNGFINTLTPAAAATPGAADALCTLYYFVALIPEVFVTWAAYYLGYHGKLMSHAYKKGKKD